MYENTYEKIVKAQSGDEDGMVQGRRAREL